MTHPSIEAVSKTDGVVETTVDIAALPIMMLPRWYWGVASVAAVAMIGADYNGVIDAPFWLATMPLYGPFAPIALVISVMLALLFTVLIGIAMAIFAKAAWIGLPMLGRMIWRNTFGRFRKSEA